MVYGSLPSSVYPRKPTRMPASLGFEKYALSFNGSTNYVEVPDSPSLDITDKISIEVLVNRRAHWNSGGIVYKVSEAGNYRVYGIFEEYGDDDRMRFNLHGVLDWRYLPSIGYDTWHHLVGTWDGNYACYYMDGNLVRGPLEATGTIETSTKPLYIGRSTEGGLWFNGTIAFVRIYKDYALTPEEVRWNMCFPPDTLIMANPSPKNIDKISVGDPVLTATGFEPVTRIFKRYFKGSLITLKPAYLPPIRLTPEHPVLAVRGRKCDGALNMWCRPNCHYKRSYCPPKEFWQLQWVKAADLNERDFLVLPKFKAEWDLRFSILPQNGEVVHLKKGFYLKYDNSKRVLPETLTLTEGLAELIGWYLAEGYNYGNGIEFGFGSDEGKYVERVAELIKQIFKIDAGIYDRPNEIVVRASSRALAEFFKNFGKNSRDRRIPSWLFYARKEFIKSLLKAWMLGDGSIYENKAYVCTVSRTLAYQALFLFSKLDILPHLSKTTSTVKNPRGKVYHDYEAYHLKLIGKAFHRFFDIPPKSWTRQNWWEDESNFYLPIRDIAEESYDGYVYNFETPSHTYTAPVIVHNCNYHNPVHPEYLRLWLPMEEGSGLTVYDKSGHGNNGSLLPADDPPTWQRVRQWELRAEAGL